MSEQHAVVLGGAGFLGSHVAHAMLNRGWKVTVVDNMVTGRSDNLTQHHPRLRLIEFDITRSSELHVTRVTHVLHMASPASPKAYMRFPTPTLMVGSVGTLHALQLARRHQARYLLASTSEVYGDPQVHPQTEDYWGHVNPVGPRSMYDEAKRFAEALTTVWIQQKGVDGAIARIFNTYGPRMRADDGRVVSSFISQALANEHLEVYGDGQQTRSLCYVDDTVAGLLALLDSNLRDPVNIGNPDEISILNLAWMVQDVVGHHPGVRHLPAWTDDPSRRCPDITRARTLLGWMPHTKLGDGLKRTAGWFQRLG